MLFEIDHMTRYEYSLPVQLGEHLLRFFPLPLANQRPGQSLPWKAGTAFREQLLPVRSIHRYASQRAESCEEAPPAETAPCCRHAQFRDCGEYYEYDTHSVCGGWNSSIRLASISTDPS